MLNNIRPEQLEMIKSRWVAEIDAMFLEMAAERKEDIQQFFNGLLSSGRHIRLAAEPDTGLSTIEIQCQCGVFFQPIVGWDSTYSCCDACWDTQMEV